MTWSRTAVVAGAAMLVAGAAGGGTGHAAAATAKVVKLTEVQTSFSTDFKEDGLPRVGGSFFDTTKLLLRGHKVGTGRSKCTFTKITGPADNPSGGTTRCKITLKFGKGNLTAIGKVPIDFAVDGPTFTIPIVSGTGKYVGAKGTLKHVQAGDVKSNLTLRYTIG